MSGRYRVTNRLGIFAAGRRFAHGEEADLTDEQAAPLLAASAIEDLAPATSPKPARRRPSSPAPADVDVEPSVVTE